MIGPIMLDLQDKEITVEEKELLQHPHVGGIILFTRNYYDISQLKNLITTLRKTRPELLIAVDQEGGRVQRFREGFSSLPSLNEIKSKKLAFEMAQLMAQEILATGIDFSFAPILDVDIGKSSIIGNRSFAADAKIVSELASDYISGMNSVGMQATGKHFPGHGGVAGDSHTELPIDNRDFKTLWENDLLPFRLLKDQLAAIMMAHVLYPQIDNKPASFSKKWIQEILRKKINYSGAIFSDDLTMQGAEMIGDYLTRAQIALEAGCDMIIICNNRPQTIKVIDGLRYRIPPTSQKRLLRMSMNLQKQLWT